MVALLIAYNKAKQLKTQLCSFECLDCLVNSYKFITKCLATWLDVYLFPCMWVCLYMRDCKSVPLIPNFHSLFASLVTLRLVSGLTLLFKFLRSDGFLKNFLSVWGFLYFDMKYHRFRLLRHHFRLLHHHFRLSSHSVGWLVLLMLLTQ